MNINKWNKVYEKNKYLDTIFIKKYKDTEDYFKKNCIEFLVELSEFINESKCFKYWSIKKPNKEDMMLEYADVITMVLYFYNNLDMKLDIDNLPSHIESKNIFDVINYLYLIGTDLINNYSVELVKDILSNLLYLGELFNLNEEEILESVNKKHKIIEKRLNSDY